MKKSLSYVLPLIALAVLALLAFRWMSNRPDGSIPATAESAEGIEINDVTGDDEKPQGIVDMESTKLTSPGIVQTPQQGEIRYGKTDDDKTRFTISADLPELKDKTEFYQLWVEGSKRSKKSDEVNF